MNADKTVKCPRCSSKNISKTGLGITERTVAYALGFTASILVSPIIRYNGADRMVREAISIEFKCKSCSNTFRSKINE